MPKQTKNVVIGLQTFFEFSNHPIFERFDFQLLDFY